MLSTAQLLTSVLDARIKRADMLADNLTLSLREAEAKARWFSDKEGTSLDSIALEVIANI